MIWSAVFRIDHQFQIAVVGGDYGASVMFEQSADNFAEAGIDRLHRLYRGLENTGMPYHIAVCKI